MARISKAEVIALAEDALARGDRDIWRKVIDDARAGNSRALNYLREGLAPVEEPQPPFLGWKCVRCGRKLPKTGYVWKHRWHKWKTNGKDTSGLYCDRCADCREMGIDEY